MSKRTIVEIIALVVLIGGYIVYDFSKKTTYEKVLTDLIGENGEVEQLFAYSDVPFMAKSVGAEINNQATINEVLGYDIKLKKIPSDQLPPITTTLVLKIGEETFEVGVETSSIMIGSQRYLMTDQLFNPIMIRLYEDDIKWEIGEYQPFTWL